MKSSELFEAQIVTKKIDWISDPELGWFMESNPFRVYYGARMDEAADLLKNGIYANDEGYVRCALEPHTAYFQAMPLTESCNEDSRVVLVIDIPVEYSNKNPVYSESEKVTNKELYENWGKSDAEYYALVEVDIPNVIPASYIKGYMVKNDS